MVEKNYNFLTSEVFPKLGFGDTLNDVLKTKMTLDIPAFDIKVAGKFGKDEVLYILNLDRKEGQIYFLNEMKAKLTKENGEVIDQKFPLYKQRGFTKDEMYNLLNGRSVHKTFDNAGERVGRWSKLDMTQKNENGQYILRNQLDSKLDFNPTVELGKLPIGYMPQTDKEMLLKGLLKGNRESLSVNRNGQRERVFLEADPQMGQIRMFNSSGQRISMANNNLTVVQDQKEEKGQKELPQLTKALMDKKEKPAPKLKKGVSR